eukprot:gene56471-75405_t
MTQVTVGENEGIESALRRFKRQVSKAGIFADLKRLRHHETPVEKYKRKTALVVAASEQADRTLLVAQTVTESIEKMAQAPSA